jgi:ribonuclease BN (tRNA processing enzyme)
VQADDEAGRTWSVLLDLGNGALGPLQRHVDPAALDAVALSHLHADHVADMPVLGVLLRYRPGPRRVDRLDVWGPAGTLERLAHLAGKDPAADTSPTFAVHVWDPEAPVVVGPMVLTPMPVLHSVPAFGVRVVGPSEDDPGRRVTLVYTGDTDAGPDLDALAAGADLLLCEASNVDGRDDAHRGVHLSGRRAGEAGARAGAGRLVVTHVPPWNDPADAAAAAREAYAGPVDVAAPAATHLL